jgi:RNA polymerase sigma-70 factor (ECF subfamily)
VIALERLPSLREPSALRSWLAQIAISRVRRRFRRQKLMRLLGLDQRGDELFESLAARDAHPDVHIELAALGRVLRGLATEQQIAWTLHYVEGETLERTALMCGCSLATVKRRIAAADLRVRASIDLEDAP